jgi:putative membrane protein (TIGR04086 family)
MQRQLRTAPAPEPPRFRLRAVVGGAVLALVLTALVAGVTATVLLTTALTERYLPWVVNSAGFVCIFAGGFFSARSAGSLGWFHGASTGLLYVLLAYVFSALFFAPVAPLWPARALFAVLAGLIGGMLGVNW